MSSENKQFDLQGLINNIKTMINPGANTPDPDPEDAVGIKLAELSILVQHLQESYVEQGKQLAKVNKLFNEVYQHLEAFKQKKAEAENANETVDKAKDETNKT